MKPNYGLNEIKITIDRPTFERAVGLYESGKVTKFTDTGFTNTATVLGGNPYEVFVSKQSYDRGNCTCYLGQKNTLCKHMVAVAIYAVMDGGPLTEENKQLIDSPVCSDRLWVLSEDELGAVKQNITASMRYIKPYNGPSRTWFAYQDSLIKGCRLLSAIVTDLPVSEQTAKLLVNLLIRLDKKLCTGGVDDSDGTVGGFIEKVVYVLEKFAQLDPKCTKSFGKLMNRETCFGWEEPLVRLFDERGN